MTIKEITFQIQCHFLHLVTFYANFNADNSFFRYFHRSEALNLHETLIEKIYSGKKRYHSNLYDQCLPNYHILKIQLFF